MSSNPFRETLEIYHHIAGNHSVIFHKALQPTHLLLLIHHALFVMQNFSQIYLAKPDGFNVAASF